MQNTVNGAATKPRIERAEPRKLRKRIGSTTIEVSIRFSETSTESYEDKLLRLMVREAKSQPSDVPQTKLTADETEEL